MAGATLILALDASLSLGGLRMGSVYTNTLELIESIEDWKTAVIGDILFIGTGDNGDGCEWLCGSMKRFGDIHDAIEGEFMAMGHTALLESLCAIGDRLSSEKAGGESVVLFLTDGEFGFLTPEEISAAVEENIPGCTCAVLLVGYAYDEEAVMALASSRDLVFKEYQQNAMMERLKEICGGRR